VLEPVWASDRHLAVDRSGALWRRYSAIWRMIQLHAGDQRAQGAENRIR
jgi:hypothetical protein